MTDTGTFAAIAVALYASHHVGDYWVQTDHQARHKGDAGHAGDLACMAHVSTYVLTQAACLLMLAAVTGVYLSLAGVVAGLGVSGVTHYLADRRDHGVMFRLARMLPGKAAFLELGKPRDMTVWPHNPDPFQWKHYEAVKLDNPTLGTGGWALDQAWHIFWGVFVAALLMAGLS